MSDEMVGTPWRYPSEESVGLYPGLVVHDGRVSGSITCGQSRLPLWAFVHQAVIGDAESALDDYEAGAHEFTPNDLALFLHNLLELRGEFGRLLLILADAERSERNHRPWWDVKKRRKRVADQLRRCLECVE